MTGLTDVGRPALHLWVVLLLLAAPARAQSVTYTRDVAPLRSEEHTV